MQGLFEAFYIERLVEVIVAPLRGEVYDKLEIQIKKVPNQQAAMEY